MAKRKLNGQYEDLDKPAKKAKNLPPSADAIPTELLQKFRSGLFHSKDKNAQKEEYRQSKPYKHGVIRNVVDSGLLQKVLDEVQNKIHFTLKETDIYRIHQSGDLANLDGLEDSALKELPGLLELRNALYSVSFRKYLSEITGSGKLSGRKTDMAINIYTPGCHLLCHDDVIGSRRVSYILYLTRVWKDSWGGALRLYPTASWKNGRGKPVQVPNPEPVKSIPPAWNQMSFFAVQPGESYHDVEEVYSAQAREGEGADDDRIRVAISGWYHIPQEGEDGYKPGFEERVAARSSLTQLQSKTDEFDLPQTWPVPYFENPKVNPGLKFLSSEVQGMVRAQGFKLDSGFPKVRVPADDPSPEILTESDCDFLLKYMNPRYLTPEWVNDIKEEFESASAIRVDEFLNTKFGNLVKKAIQIEPHTMPTLRKSVEKTSIWSTAQPPHKHRYLYLTAETPDPNNQDLTAAQLNQPSPVRQLLVELFPSLQFRKWIRLATRLVLKDHDVRARRFRRGNDYQLATAYTEDEPRLELSLGLTSGGLWEAASEEEDNNNNNNNNNNDNNEEGSDGQSKAAKAVEVNNGGDEVWMAGDEETASGEKLGSDDDNDDETSSASDTDTSDATTVITDDDDEDNFHLSQRSKTSTSTSTSKRKPKANHHFSNPPKEVNLKTAPIAAAKSKTKQSSDPAIYQSAPDDNNDDDESILFHMPAGWNRLSMVLRDRGTLRFVKYVSASAMADRWDVTGDYGVDWAETERVEAEDAEKDAEEGEGGEEEEEGEEEGEKGEEGEEAGEDEGDDEEKKS